MTQPDDKSETAEERPEGEDDASEQDTPAAGDDEASEAPSAEASDEAAKPEDDPSEEPEELEVSVEELVQLLEEARAAAVKAREESEQATARLRSVSKAYKDLQAENKAFRDRTEAQAAARAKNQAARYVEAFFEPVENLKRSLAAADNPEDSFASGIKMVLRQFMEAMKKLGLVEVAGVGAPFDPSVHEALALIPVDDPEADGKVMVVHNTGYRVGDKTLRAAQVVVGKYDPPAAEPSEEAAPESTEAPAAEDQADNDGDA